MAINSPVAAQIVATATVAPKAKPTLNKVEPAKTKKVKSKKKSNNKVTKKAKDKIFYKGLYIGQSFFDFNGHYYNLQNKMYEFEIGFFTRWFFYKYGLIQVGLNGTFEWTDESYLKHNWNDYYNTSLYFFAAEAEVPISLRFGLPFKISPYFSLNTFIRKPIYRWVTYTNERSHNNSSYKGNAGMLEDFEFLWTYGFGVEISRKLSIEIQWLINTLRTEPNKNSPYKNDGINRVQINLAF